MSDTLIDKTGEISVKTNITYDVESGVEIIKTSLPFRIGILLDTNESQEKPLADQLWIELKPDNNIENLLHKFNISEESQHDLSRFLGNVISMPMVQVLLINRNKADFADDLAGNTLECELYKVLNKMETDLYGIGLNILMTDFRFTGNANDTILLQKISAVAEEVQVPFIAATNDSQARTDLSFVRLQASEAINTYHNPAFDLAEQILIHFDRYAWPVVSEEPETFSYLLIACRFAQYIKRIMRNKIGSFLTRDNLESFLNTWISQYVLLDDKASLEVQAACPLKSALIKIMDMPGEPGSYAGVLFIEPQFLLGAPPASLNLVFRIPS